MNIGTRLGSIEIVRFLNSRDSRGNQFCEYKCDCGNLRVTTLSNFKRTKSCGCRKKEFIAAANRKHGDSPASGSLRLYRIWANMIQRCENPRNPKYYLYGGRGIRVCSEWSDYRTFKRHVGNPPSRKHELDRINNNGNYEPDNVRWATRSEQIRNTRRNVWIEAFGKRMVLSDWAKLHGIDKTTLAGRIKQGWPVELALTKKPVVGQKVMWNK